MIVNQLIEKAMKKASGAQASLGQSESTDVSFENDRLKSVKSSQSTGMSVKVIVNGKVGSSHTTDINDVDGVVARALEVAEFGSPAHFEFPEPREGTEVNVYDNAVLPVAKDEMVHIGEEMIALVKEYNPDIILHAGAGKSVDRSEFANSSGVEYTTESTDFGVGVHGQWIRGTDILWAGHGFGWRKREIDHLEIARKAIEWFKMAEKIAPIKSSDMPVIFTPDGMNVLLLALRLGFNGKNVFLGSSPLAGKLGEKIADERFSITDNPLIDYASSSDKYDGEGVPHQITPLIENGVIKNFLYDLDTAGRAGTKTTGNGVGCGTTNLVIKEGDTPYEEMVTNTKEGLLVHSVMGLGQGNAISGEFSVNVQLGYKIENGEIVGRVKDVMLAGNTYDALKNIAAIGDKAEWAGWSLLTPPIKIGKVSVVAR
ncbi:TldD/PmbA family protein [Candidatus Poribacteria bacterium]|nr:TldD/PmbA family protein [Candidatus Poribacteria bacterium]